MKRIAVAIVLMAACASAMADQWVNGYTKKDGTYVEGHHRSTPNQYRYDNYSSQGNSNPYTGQQGGSRNEYSSTPQFNNTYGNVPGYNNSYGSNR